MDSFRGIKTLIFALVLSAMLFSLTACSDPAEELSVDELLTNASTEVMRYDYKKAKKYAQIARDKSEEGSADWAKATFLMALCFHQEQPSDKSKVDRAAALYEEVIKADPKSILAAKSHLWLGRVDQARDYGDDQIDVNAARESYQKVIEGWPGTLEASEATLRLANTYIETFDPAEAAKGVKILEDWLKKHPNDPLNSGMWVYLGGTYKGTMKDPANALRSYLNADEAGLLDPNGAGDIFWNIAKLALVEGNEALAVKYYRKVILEASSSGLAFESQLALKELGHEAPEIPALKFFKEDASATQPAPATGEGE